MNLNTLPIHILRNIANNLDPLSRLRFAFTCRKTSFLSQEPIQKTGLNSDAILKLAEQEIGKHRVCKEKYTLSNQRIDITSTGRYINIMEKGERKYGIQIIDTIMQQSHTPKLMTVSDVQIPGTFCSSSNYFDSSSLFISMQGSIIISYLGYSSVPMTFSYTNAYIQSEISSTQTSFKRGSYLALPIHGNVVALADKKKIGIYEPARPSMPTQIWDAKEISKLRTAINYNDTEENNKMYLLDDSGLILVLDSRVNSIIKQCYIPYAYSMSITGDCGWNIISLLTKRGNLLSTVSIDKRMLKSPFNDNSTDPIHLNESEYEYTISKPINIDSVHRQHVGLYHNGECPFLNYENILRQDSVIWYVSKNTTNSREREKLSANIINYYYENGDILCYNVDGKKINRIF